MFIILYVHVFTEHGWSQLQEKSKSLVLLILI